MIIGIALGVGVLVALVLQEWSIRRARKKAQRLDEYKWRETERLIAATASDPARMASMEEVRARLAAQQSYLDMVCRSAAASLKAPKSVITMVEADKQTWVAHHFTDPNEPDEVPAPHPLTESYCKYVINSGKTLVIENSTKDPLVKDHQCTTVIGMRAYLGVPVYSQEGFAVGSLCVFDYKPRKWSTRDRVTIESLASLVTL